MEVAIQNNNILKFMKQGLGVPVGLVILLAMMILPIPAILLDLFFTFNIALSLLILLAGIYSLRPLDFAVFPTILLVSTLFRLALNVASTRVVLLNGHNGADAAGHVIEAFGKVVIGGNYAVGFVVFTILIIINFVVVTKGAGRISEVTARFTLDALPGKQMAIDADLNAGLISQDEAKERREEVSQEADFYGAMDGASKFVRGDAIAGILILFINIIGGIIVGVMQHNLSFSDAAEIYALLTIGDGLVAQVPSLILSTAAAILVTRVSRSQDVGKQMFNQVFSHEKPLFVSSGVLIGMGLIPGMPHFAFVSLGAAIAATAYYLNKQKLVETTEQKTKEEIEEEKALIEKRESIDNKELDWDDVPQVDLCRLEIGYRLIPLVDKEKDGELMTRIKGVRKKVSMDLGFLIPSVHIRDNLDISPNSYRISVLGVTVGEAEIHPDKELAINPGQVFGQLNGIPTTDPAFGLEAFWIDKDMKQNAQTLGYTVVDPSTVIATHISQVFQNHAYQLLGHEDVQTIFDNLAKDTPKLVEDLIPNILPLGVIVKVLQNLLKENVSIKDMRTIAETLTEAGQKSQEPGYLTSCVRTAISGLIIQGINGFNKELSVITLEHNLEQILQKSMKAESEGSYIEPSLAERIQSAVLKSFEKQEAEGKPSVLLVSGTIRAMMSRFVRSFAKGMHVLSYQEIPETLQVRVVGTIGE